MAKPHQRLEPRALGRVETVVEAACCDQARPVMRRVRGRLRFEPFEMAGKILATRHRRARAHVRPLPTVARRRRRPPGGQERNERTTLIGPQMQQQRDIVSLPGPHRIDICGPTLRPARALCTGGAGHTEQQHRRQPACRTRFRHNPRHRTFPVPAPVSAEHPGYDPAPAKRGFGDRRPASTAGGALDRRAGDVAVPRPGQMTPDAAIGGAR